jgi:hypothetical protein
MIEIAIFVSRSCDKGAEGENIASWIFDYPLKKKVYAKR